VAGNLNALVGRMVGEDSRTSTLVVRSSQKKVRLVVGAAT
jgi:hypothetical protein